MNYRHGWSFLIWFFFFSFGKVEGKLWPPLGGVVGNLLFSFSFLFYSKKEEKWESSREIIRGTACRRSCGESFGFFLCLSFFLREQRRKPKRVQTTLFCFLRRKTEDRSVGSRRISCSFFGNATKWVLALATPVDAHCGISVGRMLCSLVPLPFLKTTEKTKR